MFEFEPEKQTQAKQADIESVVELDLGKDVEIEKENSSNTAAAGGGEVVLEKQPTTTTAAIIFDFQKECEQLGFPITESRARSILNAGISPAWLTGPGSFPVAIAAYVNDQYSDKASDERLKLFLSALTWEDKQEDYRDFLEKWKTQTEKNPQAQFNISEFAKAFGRKQGQGRRIANDQVDAEDISKYFREA
jgi:hypothetical protein